MCKRRHKVVGILFESPTAIARNELLFAGWFTGCLPLQEVYSMDGHGQFVLRLVRVMKPGLLLGGIKQKRNTSKSPTTPKHFVR